jgi:CobW/HypB/UreG, nucleotide-binding domain
MNRKNAPWLVVVGGFLASGKTTLILAAARELERRGLRSAALFNDQGHDLVDSRYSALSGVNAGQVMGGCFCCRLTDLVAEIHNLRAFAPDVIFAEPVGSCTDLAATVLRPLRALEWADGTPLQLAPLTVLADPSRTRALLGDDANPAIRFLFEKQIQEADLVCFTKSDLYPEVPQLEVPYFRQLSARSGQGVAAWLDEVLSGAIAAAGRPLEIDYAQYAQAEAALAWLNLRAEFRLRVPCSPTMLLGPLFDEIDNALATSGASVTHMKAIVSAPTGYVKAAIAAHGQEPDLEGDLGASPATSLHMLLNLRCVGEPETVRGIVEQPLRRFGKQLVCLEINCFSPAAPVPEQRIVALAR